MFTIKFVNDEFGDGYKTDFVIECENYSVSRRKGSPILEANWKDSSGNWEHGSYEIKYLAFVINSNGKTIDKYVHLAEPVPPVWDGVNVGTGSLNTEHP